MPRTKKPRSAMGTIMKPVDVTSESQISEFEENVKEGPLIFVLVYADWCGHCQRFKPTMDKLEKTPGRTVQIARVRDDMYPKTSIAHNAIEGYPTLMLVKPDGNAVSFKENGKVTNSIPDYTNEQAMTAIVKNAGTNTGIRLLENGTVPTPENMTANNVSTPQNVVYEPVAENIQNTAGPVTAAPAPELEFSPPNSNSDRILKDNLNQYMKKNTMGEDQYRQNPQAVQMGGSLYNTLYQTAYHLAPVAGLYIGARYSSLKGRTRKGRKGPSRKRQSKKARRTLRAGKNTKGRGKK